jgi:hypothetical protein
MSWLIALTTLLAINQETPRANPSKRVTGTIPAPASGALEPQVVMPASTHTASLPPDIDLRVVELQALVSHYQRICEMLLELEFEHEMTVIDTGADHPEKNRGIKRLDLLKRRKAEIGRKIEAIRAEIRESEGKKTPAGKP